MIGRAGRGALVAAILAPVLAIGMAAMGHMLQARASERAPLLPDLVAAPPDGAVLVTSSLEGRARLLLRFNGYIHNLGPGALDIRGSRAMPTAAGLTEARLVETVYEHKDREEVLPQALEEELALPAMHVSQRMYYSNEGEAEKGYLERAHVEEAMRASMAYSNADGHHHWHLKSIAKYSLWNGDKTAEVAPSQKVGFCLEDSLHVEPTGPANPVYAPFEPPYGRLCRRFEPDATEVFEGISPGWEDMYSREIAFQWVDVSDLAPGEYWLREDVDPEGLVKQTGAGSKSSYAAAPTVIPGFDAESETVSVTAPQSLTVHLHARAYEDTATPSYSIASPPQHGSLGQLEGDQVTYTPDPGYAGADSFSFAARDPNSPFPEDPALATVSVTVGSAPPPPAISLSGGQAAMVAGTSVPLTAHVVGDTGNVEWEASAGTISSEGEPDGEGLYRAPAAPPPGGTVTITARLQDDPTVSAQETIAIEPVPPVEPVPQVPGGESAAGGGASGSPSADPPGQGSAGTAAAPVTSTPTGAVRVKAHRTTAAISRPRAMFVGRVLVLEATPNLGGHLSLAAYTGGHTIGRCSAQTPAGRLFTCRLTLARRFSARQRITVEAALRAGATLARVVLPAGVIPEMRMRPVGVARRVVVAGSVFWCSPSMLTGVLTYGPM